MEQRLNNAFLKKKKLTLNRTVRERWLPPIESPLCERELQLLPRERRELHHPLRQPKALFGLQKVLHVSREEMREESDARAHERAHAISGGSSQVRRLQSPQDLLRQCIQSRQTVQKPKRTFVQVGQQQKKMLTQIKPI